ncbi:MAG: FSR family fosmidomycin resistance protein-like MFS transporter [Sulfurimonas sp.]|jgi:FSR family fosmidomycin resistance protein-like MFS transporter
MKKFGVLILSKVFNKAQVATISLAHLAHDTYGSFLAPILPLLIEKLGISLYLVALLDISRKLPSLLNPFFGILAERTDARYFVILSPAITAISMSLLGLASSYEILIILLIIAGISSTLFHIPSPGVIKESSGNKVGLGMSLYMVGGELARTLAPLMITAGISLWGLEGTWRLMPFGLIASFILYLRLKDFKMQRTYTKKAEKGDTLAVAKDVMPLLGVMSGYMFFQSAMKMATTLYLAVYLTQHDFSLWTASIALSVLQFFGVIGTFLSGSLSDKIGRQNMLVFTSSASALCMTAFLFTESIYTMFPILSLLGLFIFSSTPVLLAIIHEVDTKMPIFVNSLYMSVNFSISSIVVLLMGIYGDLVGLDETYVIATVLAFCAIPFAMMLNRVTKSNL